MTKKIVVAICFMLAGCAALCQTIHRSHSFGNGAGTLQGSSLKLKATLGQSFIGTVSSSSYKLQAGFDASTAMNQIGDLDFVNVLTINPTSVTRGNGITAFFTVKNIGNLRVDGDIHVAAFLSANPDVDIQDQALGSSVVIGSELLAGGEINYSAGMPITIPADVSPGSYYIVLVVNPDETIKEDRFTNNAISTSISVLTDDDTTPPVILLPSASPFLDGASISLTVTDDKGVKQVQFFHRPVTGVDFEPAAMTPDGTTYSVVIQDAWADDIGMEGYFQAEDHALNQSSSPANYLRWYRVPDPDNAIPFASGFNGKTHSYQMFSIPYVPADDDISDIFETSLNGYDATQWRLFHYRNTGYSEYPQHFRKIALGEAYWFNTIVKDFDIRPGVSQMYAASQANPFPLKLSAGWNQIGNPYPFNISWSAVIGANDKIGSLWFFNNGAYTKSDLFKPWTGAFVHADEAMTLPIPVLSKTNQSGRTSQEDLTADLDSDQWLLPISVRIDETEQVSGVGMHPHASASKDRYDEITIPRFLDYAEMSTYHGEFFSPHFSMDVVPTTGEYAWTFEVKSNLEDQPGQLTWDHLSIEANTSSLILIDLLEGKWVDMKTINIFSFTHREGRQLRIIYNRGGEINPGITLLGDAYPNPFAAKVTFPVLVHEPGRKQIDIYDGFGRLIQRITADIRETGVHEITWDFGETGSKDISSGMLYYRMLGDRGGKMKRLFKK